MSLRVGLVVDHFIGSFKVLGVGVRSEVDLVSIKSGSNTFSGEMEVGQEEEWNPRHWFHQCSTGRRTFWDLVHPYWTRLDMFPDNIVHEARRGVGLDRSTGGV
jgi:hypothetical protein